MNGRSEKKYGMNNKQQNTCMRLGTLLCFLEKGTWTEKDVEERQRWIIGQVEIILEVKLNGGTERL
jgi:hypothetical protein